MTREATSRVDVAYAATSASLTYAVEKNAMRVQQSLLHSDVPSLIATDDAHFRSNDFFGGWVEVKSEI